MQDLLHLANRSCNRSTVMIHRSSRFQGELSLGGGDQIRHSLPEARLLVFLLGDGHRRRLRIVQTQANLCLARQPARVNTFHLICTKRKRRTQTGSVWWKHVATLAPVTADQRTVVSDTSRREATVCLVIMNDLETSAVQNRGSDYNVVYREVNSTDGLSTWVSKLLKVLLSIGGVNLHTVFNKESFFFFLLLTMNSKFSVINFLVRCCN